MQQGDEPADLLSTLPDSILHSILCLLPLSNAVATSVLSHRWHHIWTELPHLHITQHNVQRHLTSPCDHNATRLASFISIVDNIFHQLTCPKLISFSLKFHPSILSNTDHQSCLQHALDRWARRYCALNVEHLSIRQSHESRSALFPACTFQCRSLVVLQLVGGFRLNFLNDEITYLPNLKKLLLHNLSEWNCKIMSTLFMACPVLEDLELTLVQNTGLVNVSCQNLRSLIIAVHNQNKFDYVIEAPMLKFIHLSGRFMPSGASSISFVQIPSSLVKAKIEYIYCSSNHVNDDCLRNFQLPLTQGICSVKSLEVDSSLLYPFMDDFVSFVGVPPIYYNLEHIQICVNETTAGDNLLHCLHCTPNLKALIIRNYYNKMVKWNVPDLVPECLSHKLKRIEISPLVGMDTELEFLKYILVNANVLERLIVRVTEITDLFTILPRDYLIDELRFCEELFSYPRSSKPCVIIFQGPSLRASS